MHISSNEKIFFFILLFITLLITISILYPFLTILILAGAFAVVLNPIYQWIKKRIYKNSSTISSLITVVLFIIVICGPILFIGSAIINQAQHAYNSIIIDNHRALFESINTSVNKILPLNMSVDIESKITEIISFVSKNATSLFTTTFQTVVMFILMVMAMFYLLKDGKEWKKSFASLCPLSEENIEEIFSRITITINQIIKGTFIIAIIQGILTALGFIIFGVPNSALWAVTAGIASFIPTFGTSIVLVPAILFLYFTGMKIHALGLLIWSLLIVSTVDNILSPFIISKKTNIPSMFILFSILGGISLLGPVGILIGPLTLSLLYSLIYIYKKETSI